MLGKLYSRHGYLRSGTYWEQVSRCPICNAPRIDTNCNLYTCGWVAAVQRDGRIQVAPQIRYTAHKASIRTRLSRHTETC